VEFHFCQQTPTEGTIPIYFAGGTFEGFMWALQFFGSLFKRILSLAFWGAHLIQRMDLDEKWNVC